MVSEKTLCSSTIFSRLLQFQAEAWFAISRLVAAMLSVHWFDFWGITGEQRLWIILNHATFFCKNNYSFIVDSTDKGQAQGNWVVKIPVAYPESCKDAPFCLPLISCSFWRLDCCSGPVGLRFLAHGRSVTNRAWGNSGTSLSVIVRSGFLAILGLMRSVFCAFWMLLHAWHLSHFRGGGRVFLKINNN